MCEPQIFVSWAHWVHSFSRPLRFCLCWAALHHHLNGTGTWISQDLAPWVLLRVAYAELGEIQNGTRVIIIFRRPARPIGMCWLPACQVSSCTVGSASPLLTLCSLVLPGPPRVAEGPTEPILIQKQQLPTNLSNPYLATRARLEFFHELKRPAGPELLLDQSIILSSVPGFSHWDFRILPWFP